MISGRKFAEQANVTITFLFLSLLRRNCYVVQSFGSHEFPERIFSSLHFFITGHHKRDLENVEFDSDGSTPWS